MPGRRLALAAALATVLAATPAVVLGGAPASATAAAARPAGAFSATQDTFAHRLQVRGWAYDQTHPSASVRVRIYGDGHYLATVSANGASTAVDRAHHIAGRHAFTAVANTAGVQRVTITTVATQPVPIVSGATRIYQPPAGTRIVTLAKRYVGKARYVDGGSSPRTGFDCSGFTAYIYASAKVARLPHDAEAQRHVKHMKVVSAAAARPGDLIFYFAGGPAYHVAIYAGHGMQYAAATPRDGIRYQAIWSSDIEFSHYG